MRATRIVIRSVALLTGLVSLLVVSGCPKHENFPTEIELVTAPAPSNFVISALGDIDSDGDYDYDLSWSISDPTYLSRFRLYLVGGGLAPELAAEPTSTTLAISLPFDAAGLQFGLSTVSTGLVETAMVVREIPPLPTSN